MRFKSDGSCLTGEIGVKHDKSGKWILNEVTNTLELIFTNKKEDDGVFSILEITRKSLVIKKGGLTVYMDHGDL